VAKLPDEHVREKPAREESRADHPESQTERKVEREEEDKEYLPVILKRSDEAVRHPDDILENAINEGLEQLERPPLSLFLSAMAAGLILGFTAMAVAVVQSHAMAMGPEYFARLAIALVYPLGFILCIMSGTQLFTEHTATAVYPVLDQRGKVIDLLRLWVLIIAGNLIGAVLSSGLLVLGDEVVHARKGYIEIGLHLVNFGSGSLFTSALLAGWLMALGAWLVMATQPTLSQMVSIYIVTFIIGLGELHHSIAGSVEIFTAYFISDQFSLGQVCRFIGVAILGNMVGGSIFVALLNYAHIRQTQIKKQD